MVKVINNRQGKSPAFYTSPSAEVLKIDAEDIICVSGGTEDLTDGSGGFFDGTENLGNGDTTGWF